MDIEDDFSVERRDEGDVAVVVPTGEIDMASAGAVRRRLEEALEGGGGVVLDLREVTFFDTSGLHVILETEREARRQGRRFALTRPREEVASLFEIAGLTSRLTWVDDPREAGADGSATPP